MTRVRGAGPSERERAAGEAAAALERGQLAVLPTETVYGVFARADEGPGTDRLTALAGGKGGPWGWHAPSRERVRSVVELRHPAHRRLVGRLTPGPVTFLVEREAEELAALPTALEVGPAPAPPARH